MEKVQRRCSDDCRMKFDKQSWHERHKCDSDYTLIRKSSDIELSICRVCYKLINLNQPDLISPYPSDIHGHCWLHIIAEGSPIPWPDGIPRPVGNKNSSLHGSNDSMSSDSSSGLPTIKRIQSLYRTVSRAINLNPNTNFNNW